MRRGLFTVITLCILLLLGSRSAAAQNSVQSLSCSIPYISSLIDANDLVSFKHSLDNGSATTVNIDKVNWPDAYPYAPVCSAQIAFTDGYLAILFHVEGLDLRTMVTTDNGSVYQDSCVEFFILSPDGKNYYNFEMNAAGYLHSAIGPDIKTRTLQAQLKLDRVKRFTTFGKGMREQNDKSFSWDAGMLIPFDLMGIDKDNIPDEIKCNLYKCADKSAHPHYISWSPVGTPKPNFHSPSYFGTMKFEK